MAPLQKHGNIYRILALNGRLSPVNLTNGSPTSLNKRVRVPFIFACTSKQFRFQLSPPIPPPKVVFSSILFISSLGAALVSFTKTDLVTPPFHFSFLFAFSNCCILPSEK